MSGIVNGGQYCYFSSLIQCLVNSTTVRSKVQEHADAVAQDPSECQPVFLETKPNNRQLNSGTIFAMTLCFFQPISTGHEPCIHCKMVNVLTMLESNPPRRLAQNDIIP